MAGGLQAVLESVEGAEDDQTKGAEAIANAELNENDVVTHEEISFGGNDILAAVLASVLIFSPIQWQNWLWGIQILFFMPIACLTGAVVFCYSDFSPWAKLWISGALATIATYSYANGMICWVALLCLVLMQFERNGDKLKAAGVWIALAGGNLAAYFYGFHRVGETGKLSDSLEMPYKAIRCFLAYLGAPLGSARGLVDLKLAIIIGALIVCAAVIVAFKLLRNWKEPGVVRRSAGWLTIAAFSLGTGLILTAGRVKMTPHFLLDSRYTSYSLYLLVALIFLIAILYTPTAPHRRRRSWKASARSRSPPAGRLSHERHPGRG